MYETSVAHAGARHVKHVKESNSVVGYFLMGGMSWLFFLHSPDCLAS